jgi:hypothetical protein
MEALRQVGFPVRFTLLEIPVVVTLRYTQGREHCRTAQNRATHYF